MNKSFIIGAYWSAKAEPLSIVVDSMIQTLKRLSEIDEHFLSWYEKGMNTKSALNKPIVPNKEVIEKLCLQKVKKGELDENGYAKMGFLFGLWTGGKDEESSTITFNVGTTSKWLTNSCVIKIPLEGDSRVRLLKQEKAKEIVSILVDIWQPNYAVLTSDFLRDKLELGNRVGWITYQKTINRIPVLSNKLRYEKKLNGHWFFPLAENDYEEIMTKDFLSLKESV